ncbi:Na/Pi cotransporter family protein [Thioclava sp.]|uniref:Na/Pi cotransporter family protein n=1 Tax=Thioclava sp. TaxID=1933450 RepID=UPI003AA92C08
MENANIPMFFLHIAGAAALLIWSVRLVRTGVERAFSMPLRRWLRWSSRSRFLAAGSGMSTAILLQSSTAVALLVSNFVARGTITVAVGLAILLGADVGSAIVAQLLLLRQTFLLPLLLLVGVVMFLRGHQRRIRQTGRILIGLALIFASLAMIREATTPLVDSQGAANVMAYLARDTVTAFVIGAVFAWVVHSSVAAVLLFVTLVSQGLLPPEAAVAMVLGANMGGTFIAFMLTLTAEIDSRRMIVANFALRGGGAIILLALLSRLELTLSWLGSTPAQQVINLHLVFNIGLALLALPLTGLVTRLVSKLMPPRLDPSAGIGPASALDPAALANPERALTCAAREVMHMGEIAEAMLRAVPALFVQWDDVLATRMAADEKLSNKTLMEVKLYLAKLNQGVLSDETSTRAMDLSSNAANLSAAAEMISRNMVALARNMDHEGVRFSEQGWKEISDFHDRVLANVQLALSVMMTQNPDEARELVEEKDDIRALEQRLQRAHLMRLHEGSGESIETSNIHQETLRALKQVNTSFATVATPILSETGDLLSSRLAHRR